MSQATVRFDLGAESVTVPLDIDLPTSVPLSGDVSGTFGDCFVVGDLNLTGDLIVEGLMTGIDTFTLEGNGFQLLFQNGGRPDLAGVEKTAWIRWGDNPVNWQNGDRVAVAPTAVGKYVPTETVWGAARPVNSPDVTLVDGSVARPEVVNLTQTIVLKNLRRIHFHDGAGVATLKWLRVLNSGTTGVLSEYPIHFHLNGDSSRGSLLEGVVVEGGKNHAFVPHGSHGITQIGCAAYNTKGNAYWWDLPAGNDANRTNDLVWERCLAMLASSSPAVGESIRLTGFSLGAGTNMRCSDSAATCIPGVLSGPKQTSGFHWPEDVASVWDFHDCVSHNNGNSGIFVWQNTPHDHVVNDTVAFRNGYAGINHGAYSNFYHYHGMTLSGNGTSAVIQHAKSTTETPQVHTLTFEDVKSDGRLLVTSHNSASMAASIHRRCSYTQVVYQEGNPNGSYIRYEDCGLTPADFQLTGATAALSIALNSIIEIYEADVLVHRWQSGVWV